MTDGGFVVGYVNVLSVTVSGQRYDRDYNQAGSAYVYNTGDSGGFPAVAGLTGGEMIFVWSALNGGSTAEILFKPSAPIAAI